MNRSATAHRFFAGLVTLAAVTAGSQSWATNFYLAPNGINAPGKGASAASPALTPQGLEAAQTVKAGDTVWMAGGSYKTDFLITKGGTTASPVTYKAVAGQTPKISGATLYVRAASVVVEDITVENSVARGVDLDSAPNSVIRRAHVYGGQTHGVSVQRSANARIEYAQIHNVKGMGVMLNISTSDPGNKSPNIMVAACDIHDVGAHGVYVETDSAFVAYNEIHRVGQDPTHVNKDQGVYSKSTGIRVHGNHISDSPTNGISLRGPGTASSNTVWNNAAGGITFYNDGSCAPGTVVIENNVVCDNTQYQINIAGSNVSAQHHVAILNNTISGDRTGITVAGYAGYLAIVNNIIAVKGSVAGDRLLNIVDPVTNYLEQNNRLYYSGSISKVYRFGSTYTFAEYKAAVTGGGINASFGNPKFQNAANRNFRLMADSDCQTGSWSAFVPATDREDRTRLASSAVGAYERAVAPSQTDEAGSALTPSDSTTPAPAQTVAAPTQTTPAPAASASTHTTKTKKKKKRH